MHFLVQYATGLWVFLLAGLLPSLAAARPALEDRHGIVALDLRAEGGDVPTHLCVVSGAPSPRARDRLWDLLEAAANGPQATQTNLWRVRPEVWGGEANSAEDQRCADDPRGDCRPQVELPEGLSPNEDFYAACTADRLAVGGATVDPRPLFLLLEHLEGSPPQIESVRLAGSIATIAVAANLDHVVVTARSLGGAYLPHGRSERAIRDPARDSGESGPRSVSLTLNLTPRCHLVELVLPRTPLRPEDRSRLRVTAHGVSLDVNKCVGPLVGTEVLQVRLPQAPLGVGTIDVALGPGRGRPPAQFGGRYEGRWPKAPFALRFKQVSFSWRRPACIFPRDQCPTATLENGTVCHATPTETGCDYRCPGVVDDGAIDLDLPLGLTFERTQPTQRWTDTLARAGQTLSSYVAGDETYLSANVSHWITSVPDNAISGVEIYGEDGEAHRYGIGPLPTQDDRPKDPNAPRPNGPPPPRDFRLKVPGASCEPVRFRPIGDRRYGENVAQVDDGKLRFGKPERTARRIGFNVTLAAGGGPAFTTGGQNQGVDRAPVYFSGLGMFALEVRPRKPDLARLAFELRIGGTLGRYATTVEPSSSGNAAGNNGGTPTTPATTTTTASVGWARLFIEPGLVVSAHRQIAVGVGLGIGMALPFQKKENLLSDRLRLIFSPSLDLRFPVRSWLKLILQARGVLHEQPFALGTPDESDWSGSFLTLFGVQASF